MFKKRLFIYMIIGVSMGASAQCETIYQHMFPSSGFTHATIGEPFTYRQHLTNAAIQPASVDSELILIQVSDDELNISLKTGDTSKKLGAFPSKIGNPINMYFLERVVENMVVSAGGSPFYIRNRLKEALLLDAGEAHQCQLLLSKNGQCYAFSPFEHDKSKARMGEFGDLQIELQIDPNTPARIAGLAAFTPKHESFIFSLELSKK